MDTPTPSPVSRWWLTDPDFGRRHQTKYKMTAAEALAIDPGAQAVPGTEELRAMLPMGEQASQLMSTSPPPVTR